MVRGIKELLDEGIGHTWAEGLQMERDLLSGRLRPPHPRVGFREFLERKGCSRGSADAAPGE
jgi:hypothetical protein